MQQHFNTIDTRTVQGFDIVCSTTWEDIHPSDVFDETPEDMAEMLRKIDNGLLSWFMVRVQAFKNGILLGTDYLGGNLYENESDFVTESGGYYEDMIESAIKEAKDNLSKLLADEVA